MKYEKAIKGVRSFHDLNGASKIARDTIHKSTKYRADELLCGLSWDDLLILSMVDWNAAMEIRASYGRKVLERIQKHLDTPPEPLSEA